MERMLNERKQDLAVTEFFILQQHEANNVCDVPQLLVFIWIIFNGDNID
jgi:predicted acetyltransferase